MEGEEVTRDWRELHNKEVHNWYSSAHILQRGWDEHIR